MTHQSVTTVLTGEHDVVIQCERFEEFGFISVPLDVPEVWCLPAPGAKSIIQEHGSFEIGLSQELGRLTSAYHRVDSTTFEFEQAGPVKTFEETPTKTKTRVTAIVDLGIHTSDKVRRTQYPMSLSGIVVSLWIDDRGGKTPRMMARVQWPRPTGIHSKTHHSNIRVTNLTKIANGPKHGGT